MFSLGKLCEEHGTRITGKAVKNHISSKMAKELIAIYQTMFLPQLRIHLVIIFLHLRSQHRLTKIQCQIKKVWKLQYQKEVAERMKSFGETRCSISATSLRKKFDDLSHEVTERQERCAQSKAWDLAKKYTQVQGERQGYLLLAYSKGGSPKRLSKRAGEREREFVVDSGRVCIWSDDWTNSSLSCFSRKLPQCFFHGRNSVRIMGTRITTKAVKNNISSKIGKRIDGNKSNCVPFVVPGITSSSSFDTPSSVSSSSSSQESKLANRDSVSGCGPDFRTLIFTHLVPGDWPLNVELRILTVQKG